MKLLGLAHYLLGSVSLPYLLMRLDQMIHCRGSDYIIVVRNVVVLVSNTKVKELVQRVLVDKRVAIVCSAELGFLMMVLFARLLHQCSLVR